MSNTEYLPMITPEGATVADDLDELDELDVFARERIIDGLISEPPPNRKPVTLHPTPMPPRYPQPTRADVSNHPAHELIAYRGSPCGLCWDKVTENDLFQKRDVLFTGYSTRDGSVSRVSHGECWRKLTEDQRAEFMGGACDQSSETQQERDDPSLDVPIPYVLKTTKGKRDWSLMPLEVIGQGIDALQWAIERADNPYTRDSWRDVADWVKVFPSAELRHLTEIKTGQERDPDSGLLHAAHNLASAMIIMARALEDAKGGK